MALGLLAPALLADREAVALQGRAERAGACDAPLTARTAPAVTIPLSFASHAKAQRRRREQEIGRMSRGSTPTGRQRTSGHAPRWRASRTFAARPRMRNPGENNFPGVGDRVLWGGGRRVLADLPRMLGK